MYPRSIASMLKTTPKPPQSYSSSLKILESKLDALRDKYDEIKKLSRDYFDLLKKTENFENRTKYIARMAALDISSKEVLNDIKDIKMQILDLKGTLIKGGKRRMHKRRTHRMRKSRTHRMRKPRTHKHK